MNFTLTILGSASALPFSDRNPSAQALSVHGRLFLVDCGEGTQQRIRQEHLSFVKIEAVFISHVHGDHVFGLFGLLSSMGLYHRTAPLHVFGPQNLGPIVRFFLSYYGEGLGYDVIFHSITASYPVVLLGSAEEIASKVVRVSAFPLNHKIDCYGYRFDEIVKEGRNPIRPRSYAYCSDTAPFPELADYVRGVDLLYHEATYTSDLAAKASQYHHSTAEQAARVAAEAGVGKLLVGHYSSRIKDISALEGECRAVFADSIAVNDGDVFDLPAQRLL